ncbi:MAG: serine hydrolase domain-containing protein [Gemmatimonadota bacterium]|nr:serine hydrolase domain-containing protein [Gemmatimonadota bacterium]
MRGSIQLSRRFAVVLAVLFLLPALLAPGSILAMQADPVVDRARELVEVINDGSTAAIEQFIDASMAAEMRDAFPMEEHVNALSGMHERGAPYEIAEIETPDGLRAEVLLHSPESEAWTTLVVRVEEEAPHRVGGVGMRPATAPPPPPAGDTYTDDEIRAAMESTLADLAADERFSGAVMLARGDEIVFEAAHGEANKDFSVPNRIDTRFNLGSMNKMFTAVAIAQLVERGEMSFDDPLATFLPEFPDPESAEKIQIKHLLTHTSGLGSYFNEEFENASPARFRTVRDLMTLVEDDTLQFEPGTDRRYSNTGYLVLGRVIEVATGDDYYDYIQTHLTDPAGMESTASYQLDRVNPDLAVGYYRPDGPGTPWRNNLFLHVVRGGPAGGGYSTVGDLVRFAEALRNDTLISAETFETLASPKPEVGSPAYGYGFRIYPDGRVGHSGGFPGISSHLSFWPDGEWTIAVMSNYSGGAQPVVEQARRLIPAGSE